MNATREDRRRGPTALAALLLALWASMATLGALMWLPVSTEVLPLGPLTAREAALTGEPLVAASLAATREALDAFARHRDGELDRASVELAIERAVAFADRVDRERGEGDDGSGAALGSDYEVTDCNWGDRDREQLARIVYDLSRD